MLAVRDLTVRYGDARAVEGIELSVAEGEIVGIVGTNGAGKSSVGQALAGLVPSTGSIRLRDEQVEGLTSERRVRRGLVYVPEGRRVFKQLTVDDNLRAGAYTARSNENWAQRRQQIFGWVPRLQERRNLKAGLLSGGEQQLLAICRALMAFPSFLVLDEPSLGLSPTAIGEVTEFLEGLVAEGGLTVLILEQNAAFTSRLAQRGWLLDLGHVTRALDADEIRDPEHVRQLLSVDDEREVTT